MVVEVVSGWGVVGTMVCRVIDGGRVRGVEGLIEL